MMPKPGRRRQRSIGRNADAPTLPPRATTPRICKSPDFRTNLPLFGATCQGRFCQTSGKIWQRCGGPGRTRTSKQAVMNALPYSENSAKIGVSENVRQRSFAFGCGISLVIHWLECRAFAFVCDRENCCQKPYFRPVSNKSRQQRGLLALPDW